MEKLDVKKAKRVVYKERVYMVITLTNNQVIWIAENFIKVVMR